LDEEFAQLLQPQLAATGDGASSAEMRLAAAVVDSTLLDLASVMKASRAISSEIVLERLLTTTMRVMLENAGGQRGCFIVRKDGQLVIEGLIEVGRDAMATVRSIPVDDAEGAFALPISIVYHVLHTNSPIVIQDVSRAGRFAKDAYLLGCKPRSVLCMPLVRQGNFEGAIYMENQLAAGVFTQDRIEIIKLLAAQASISIENAKLYSDQLRLIEAQRRFVPSEFLESLHHHDIARVGPGEHVAKRMSMLFADLRNFTPLAERLDPRTLMELLNRYFVSMEPKISETGGFIDSFDGDRIKALFDVPADAPVRAGIGMWRALEDFNRLSATLSQPQLQMGIGINTGHVVLGVVGGRNRMQCSFIGDTANLASRIEQLTKVYRARLLISEYTLRSLDKPNAFAIRMVDRVEVKGKHVGVKLYEVIDAETPERRAIKLATHASLRAAMESYFAREFKAARKVFERLCSQSPDDSVPVLFAKRCERYLRVPPSLEWNGFEKLDQV
jgi:class 3 adenylate cyclase